jgi:hypothetical protein
MTSVIDSLVFTLTTMIRIPPSFLADALSARSAVSSAGAAHGWPAGTG